MYKPRRQRSAGLTDKRSSGDMEDNLEVLVCPVEMQEQVCGPQSSGAPSPKYDAADRLDVMKKGGLKI